MQEAESGKEGSLEEGQYGEAIPLSQALIIQGQHSWPRASFR